MNKKITEILKGIDKEVISEEVANELSSLFEEAVNERVQERLELEVKGACEKLDEEHANKLTKLLEAIDEDHTRKFNSALVTIDLDRTKKLKKVVSVYEQVLNKRMNDFTNKVVSKLSRYLDLYAAKALPKVQLKEAVRNTQAVRALQEIRRVAGITSSDMKSEFKQAIKEGYETIQQLKSKVATIEEEKAKIERRALLVESMFLLEKLTADLPKAKKDYVTRILSGKSPSYIKNNFEYVVEMFERAEQETIEEQRKQVSSKEIVTKGLKVPAVIEESNYAPQTPTSGSSVSEYLSELKRIDTI